MHEKRIGQREKHKEPVKTKAEIHSIKCIEQICKCKLIRARTTPPPPQKKKYDYTKQPMIASMNKYICTMLEKSEMN